MAKNLEEMEYTTPVVGQFYKAVGGWDVKVVHVTAAGDMFYAVHYPGQVGLESNPILHMMPTGISRSLFSLNEPPQYDLSKPSDIILLKE